MNILIDLNQAGLELEPNEMEAYSLQLVNELRSDLAETAALVPETNLPDQAMAGGAAFILGILQAEISSKNLGKVVNWLWNLRPKTILKISYTKDDREVALEYQTPEQLAQQLEALGTIDALMVQLIQVK
jgi:hypothetical protein